ncbi:MAG: dihydroorotate dehydrogenase electron transfer subunit [Candidatus Adiutrix sp.]|jgi:dihydroorotate dehydrogenase electron transfer subunit|nr:dihydroorotate dehydrogenase electron transfer subunit [Candidatus Adiutrix sp.]
MEFDEGPVISQGLVLENRPLAPETFLLTLECAEAAGQAGPGRFVKARAWPETKDGGLPLMDRPFSIHRADKNQLSLLYRVVGPATALMSRVGPGARVKISGPLGRGLDQVRPTAPAALYLVAGGMGLAPMALAKDWLGPDRPATLFYGERRGALQVERSWLKSWAGDFTAVTEDGQGYGGTGLATAPLEEALRREPRPVFACGPTPMLAAVAALAERLGVEAWVSVEAGMACGFGVCLTCSLPLKGGGRFRACQDGPVTDGLKVDWSRLE